MKLVLEANIIMQFYMKMFFEFVHNYWKSHPNMFFLSFLFFSKTKLIQVILFNEHTKEQAISNSKGKPFYFQTIFYMNATMPSQYECNFN